MQSFSHLSLLSASTAHDMNDEPFSEQIDQMDQPEQGVETAIESPPSLNIEMSFDDCEAPQMPLLPPLNGFIFRFGNAEFIAKIITCPTFRRVEIRLSTQKPLEISYVAQVRIRTGDAVIPGTRVVDKDVFHFSSYMHHPPLAVHVVDERVAVLHIEMRFVNLIERPHPKFNDGDVTLMFPDGEPLTTWRALLAHHSPYMKELMREVPPGGRVDVSPFCRSDFLTLLNFIYPTRMPIYRDFKGLVRAANAFEVETVLYACSRHFVDHPDWGIERKIPEAVKIELLPALEELVYRACQAGTWMQMISNGVRPEQFCGAAAYRNVICPTILKAKSMRYGQTLLVSPWKAPNFFCPLPEDRWMYVKIMVMGTPFYVNRGVLEIYGSDGYLGTENPEELIAIVTNEFIESCKQAEATVGEVVMSLFTWLHPLAPPISSRLLRAALLFAHQHKMYIVVKELEQCLILEPPESPMRLLENFVLAERLELDNFLRTNLQRVDGSCQIFGNDMISHPLFHHLSKALKERIVDRVCSGWGLLTHTLTKKQATKHYLRIVDMVGGGPPIEEGMCPETFQSINSQSIFGPRHEMHDLAEQELHIEQQQEVTIGDG
ncbi:unnamed protein product, partial [Mesorhabditis belari]|uniref:BTB domain-containing protein n=1 Tax=Mesorhabditis belari TaxID=2138241 RepID=A0AAF3FHC5_9BILA